MADWLDTTEYPFKSRYFTINDQQLHYIDEGHGGTLLFVHGTPSWSFDFRNVIKELKASFRCIAIDHIGFGLSDKPADYDYSTQNHSKTLEKFILEKDLQDITLIVHDFGGPIALQFALRHPDKVTHLVILNSWLWSSKNDPDYVRMTRVLKNPLLPFLYRYLNLSPRYILPASFGEHKLPKSLLPQYTRPFGKPVERNGPLAFARSLLHDQPWFQSLWEQVDILSSKPTLLIWGMKDPVIPPGYMEKFKAGFPIVHTLELERSGHFPQEEEPGKVAEAIRSFIRDGR